MSDSTIRRAAAADAETLSRLGAETFADTFAHLYPPEDLAFFLTDGHSVERYRDYLADPGSALWLMEAEGEAIGYALAGPCGLPHPDVTPASGELKRVYMRRPWQGGGRGGRLLSVALDWLTAEKPGPQWIGVWSENVGAQKLYARMGFEKVGEYRFKVGKTEDHEFIMRRP
jgi:GNAT superfamily N-acetyltransferase